MKADLDVWWGLPQQLRFLIAGAYNTAFGYLAFAGLYFLLRAHVHYLGIAVLCQAVSVTSAFLVHRHFVFRSRESWQWSFMKFNLSQLASFLFGMAALYALVRFGHASPLLAQALLIPPSVVLTYALHRWFSFRSHDYVTKTTELRSSP